jgi:hypothetical protein
VTQGQALAAAGTTGWSTGIHLHFQIESTPCTQQDPKLSQTCKQTKGWWWTSSIAVSFSDKDVLAKNSTGIPTSEKKFNPYTSDNAASAAVAAPIPGPRPAPAPPTLNPSQQNPALESDSRALAEGFLQAAIAGDFQKVLQYFPPDRQPNSWAEVFLFNGLRYNETLPNAIFEGALPKLQGCLNVNYTILERQGTSGGTQIIELSFLFDSPCIWRPSTLRDNNNKKGWLSKQLFVTMDKSAGRWYIHPVTVGGNSDQLVPADAPVPVPATQVAESPVSNFKIKGIRAGTADGKRLRVVIDLVRTSSDADTTNLFEIISKEPASGEIKLLIRAQNDILPEVDSITNGTHDLGEVLLTRVSNGIEMRVIPKTQIFSQDIFLLLRDSEQSNDRLVIDLCHKENCPSLRR